MELEIALNLSVKHVYDYMKTAQISEIIIIQIVCSTCLGVEPSTPRCGHDLLTPPSPRSVLMTSRITIAAARSLSAHTLFTVKGVHEIRIRCPMVV